MVVHFSSPVHVDTSLGIPVLNLRLDEANKSEGANSTTTSTANVDGIRIAGYTPGLTQFVDVGVGATRCASRSVCAAQKEREVEIREDACVDTGDFDESFHVNMFTPPAILTILIILIILTTLTIFIILITMLPGYLARVTKTRNTRPFQVKLRRGYDGMH